MLWKDDSWKGWIFSIIFLFLFIKLIFFPILSLTTGTSLPLAIVESCSMYHQGNLISDFDNWYDKHKDKYSDFEINKLDFEEFPFKKGLNKGDILFVIGTKADKLKIGDVIIFNSNQQNPIIHRIIDIQEKNNEKIFSTIGDNNNQQLIQEKAINENQIVGKAFFRIVPYAGWIKLIFFEPFRPESEKGFCSEK